MDIIWTMANSRILHADCTTGIPGTLVAAMKIEFHCQRNPVAKLTSKDDERQVVQKFQGEIPVQYDAQ